MSFIWFTILNKCEVFSEMLYINIIKVSLTFIIYSYSILQYNL